MSEERRKTNKSSTGTVPKIKPRNNKCTVAINEERAGSLSNNVGFNFDVMYQYTYTILVNL